VPLPLQLLTSLTLALGMVYVATPFAIRLADQLQFYDHPVGYKGHGAPTPYLGGAAVIAGFAAVLLLWSTDWQRTAPLLAGTALLWALGTVDDRRTLTPALRIVVELALAAGLWALDLGWNLGHGAALDLALTAFWLVAVINAFNFFDNMDGAASSMAAVVAAGVAGLGLVEGDAWLTVAAAALCGACLGFLPHNLFSSPARIFLGDGGSMPIGFAIGALAMIGTAGAAAEWQSLAMGLLLVGVPALDTTLVIVSRLRQGIPILTGGRDHMTHRTLQRVRTARSVALVLGGAQALVSALALLAIGAGTVSIVAAVALYVGAACVAIVVFDTRLRAAPAERPAQPAALPAGAEPPGRRGAGGRVELAILAVVGVALGLSPFFFAYYSSSVWAPIGLGLLALTAGLATARPVRLRPPQVLAIGGLAALAALALLSSRWAPAPDQAMVAGNRYVVLAALLALLTMLVRSWRDARWLMGAMTVAGLAAAAVVIGRLIAGDTGLFLGGRLNAPLGYVNGEAAFFLVLAWPCLAAAEQTRSRLLAAAGLFGATALAGLVVLTQSRGSVIAAAATIVAVLGFVPGRLRRLWLLALLGACLAPLVPLLLDVYQARSAGATGSGEMRRAALALLLASGIAGAGAGFVAAFVRPGAAVRRLRPVAVGIVVVAAVAAGVLAIGARGTIADTVRREADSFRTVDAQPSTSTTRLASGAGNRYDYWRVAWRAWRDHPVAGIGAGGYAVPYFRLRQTEEDVRQPHSIELQALSELGLLGVLALAAFVLAVGWGALRTSRAAIASPDARFFAVAGIGAFTAWFAQTSVDWLHLLPGVTGLALAAAAPLFIVPRAGRLRVAAPRGSARLVPAVVVAVALVVAGVSVSRQLLAEHFRDSGRAALASDPARALRDADRSLRIVPDGIASYQLKAAALARFDQPAATIAVLREALRRQPEDWVTWALLGDVQTRVGARRAAARAYGAAVRLNPRDRGLRELLRRVERR
jgi:UDP-N-acetylmuramyl pentapeptide phosphotransferase/UDP-N-acetylglucosamine-1-phosphate transferase